MSVLVISYSREDRPEVQGLVSLLRTAFSEVDGAVYWDADIDPGDRWFEEIKQHIRDTRHLFVFWCKHSAQSQEVRREFLYAFEQRTPVIPVLLDDTPLVLELSPINAVDLRHLTRHNKHSLRWSGLHLGNWMWAEPKQPQRQQRQQQQQQQIQGEDGLGARARERLGKDPSASDSDDGMEVENFKADVVKRFRPFLGS